MDPVDGYVMPPVDTIIFDEIDTGVSGKVALAMGKKMEKIAKSEEMIYNRNNKNYIETTLQYLKKKL